MRVVRHLSGGCRSQNNWGAEVFRMKGARLLGRRPAIDSACCFRLVCDGMYRPVPGCAGGCRLTAAPRAGRAL